VGSLARRIAAFPATARRTLKERVNAITLAGTDDFRRDSDLFGELVRSQEAQSRTQTAMKRGFQTPDGELALSEMLSELDA
jgi:hypothetical protein